MYWGKEVDWVNCGKLCDPSQNLPHKFKWAIRHIPLRTQNGASWTQLSVGLCNLCTLGYPGLQIEIAHWLNLLKWHSWHCLHHRHSRIIVLYIEKISPKALFTHPLKSLVKGVIVIFSIKMNEVNSIQFNDIDKIHLNSLFTFVKILVQMY